MSPGSLIRLRTARMRRILGATSDGIPRRSPSCHNRRRPLCRKLAMAMLHVNCQVTVVNLDHPRAAWKVAAHDLPRHLLLGRMDWSGPSANLVQLVDRRAFRMPGRCDAAALIAWPQG